MFVCERIFVLCICVCEREREYEYTCVCVCKKKKVVSKSSIYPSLFSLIVRHRRRDLVDSNSPFNDALFKFKNAGVYIVTFLW